MPTFSCLSLAGATLGHGVHARLPSLGQGVERGGCFQEKVVRVSDDFRRGRGLDLVTDKFAVSVRSMPYSATDWHAFPTSPFVLTRPEKWAVRPSFSSHFKSEAQRSSEPKELAQGHSEQMVNGALKTTSVPPQSHDLQQHAGRLPEETDWMPPRSGQEGRWEQQRKR